MSSSSRTRTRSGCTTRFSTQVVGQVEQPADVAHVLALDLGLELVAVARRPLQVEAALRPGGHDHGVLGQLGAHQSEDLGPVVLPVRPADAAAGDGSAAQVDALHRRAVHVDLEQRRRLRDRRHVGRAQLERGHLALRVEGVRPQRGVDQQQLVAQDPVVVERGDRVQPGQDLVAQRLLGRLVGGAVRVEALLEVAHERGGDLGVGRQHVVLVRLREARADPLAVHPVGAQDVDLAPLEAGQDDEPVQRVRLGLPAADGRDRVGQPVAERAEVERAVARAEHAEVLHPGLAVAALQPRRDLLDHAQPEVLERRHRVAELDLPARLVERDARPARLVLEPDDERLALALQPLEALDVADRQRRARPRRGSSRGSAAPTAPPARRRGSGRSGPASRSRRPSSHVRVSETSSCSRSRTGMSGTPPGDVDRHVDADALALPQHGLGGRPRRSRSARAAAAGSASSTSGS